MKINKLYFIFLIFIFFIFLENIFFALGIPLFIDNSIHFVFLKNRVLKVKIVDSPVSMQKGLSFLKTFPKDYDGMLFVFSLKPQKFWMKDMNFNIDMVWFRGLSVVHIDENLKNPKLLNSKILVIDPKTSANAVLELPEGTTKKLDLKKGNLIFILF